MATQQKIWIIGCGDIGQRLASLYHAKGEIVHAVVNSPNSVQTCLDQGMVVEQLDLDGETIKASLFENAWVYYFLPPPNQGRVDTRLENFLSHVTSAPERMVLISTTGVYGNCKGEWIDENTALNPQVDRAHRRIHAEEIMKIWAQTYKKRWLC